MKIWVSLPKNDLSLAQAAIAGGAELVKVHLNAHHRASGTVFGTFAEERPFLEALGRLPVRKAIMIGQETLPSAAELTQLKEWGFEAFNLYLHHAQPYVFESALRPVLALGHGFTEADVAQIKSHANAWVEASVVDPSDYGKPLTQEDLDAYEKIVRLTGRKVIVPSQKKVTVADLPRLAATGVETLLVGVIVTGATTESIQTSVRELVMAASKLNPS